MGAGCSSPLRRLGGKKSKPLNRDSISIENDDSLDQLTVATRLQQHEHDKAIAEQQQATKQTKSAIENEITIQSEVAEDHPSSASYYTDGRNHGDDLNKPSNVEQQQTDSKLSAQTCGKYMGPGLAAAKMMGLGGHVHDRHLLVSPALSPAPSICQSPAPNNSFVGSSVSLDLSDLNEAFKTLTLGSPDNQLNKQRIKQPERPQSELNILYANNLVQRQDDLTNYITVIFITTDNSFVNSDQEYKSNSNVAINFADTLAKQIEIHLRSICDEQSYNLRFLNLSQDHLSQNLFVNNLQSAAMTIFEQEYQDNSERFIVIVLANGIINCSSSSDVGPTNMESLSSNTGAILKQNDKRLLPTRMDAQLMNLLMNLDSSRLDVKAKDLLRLWYNQVGNAFYLKPIYSVHSHILDESKEGFHKAWQSWLQDSGELIKALSLACDNDLELSSKLALKSLSNLYIDFLTRESQLQKRTLLIRNYPQTNSIVTNQQQHQHQLTSSVSLSKNKGGLSELARQLPDPNKLTVKRIMGEQELTKTIDDWITENFNKFIECFLENRIVHGKYAPPFIERNLFIELTKQRHQLEFYLDNITEGYETKCRKFYSNQIQPILTKIIDETVTGSDPNAIATNTTTISDTSGSRQSLAFLPSANHLVIISGPKGCGKTTLFAQLIKEAAQDLFNKALIIYRFCGSTLDSLNTNRLLRSICEQFCQTQGENTAAASYIYSSKRDIMNSLNKIIKQQYCLIFLDGLESLEHPSETSLDWLCELEASDRIKIFIMLETDSPLYKKALNSYTDAMYISLDNPTISEWAQMLTYTARSKRLNSAANLYDEVKNLGSTDSSNASSITYCDVSDILNMCHIRRLNNEYIYPELNAGKLSKQACPSISDYKNIIHQGVLKHLHYILAPCQVCSFLVAISSSRNGLSEHDIVEIMDSMISQLLQKYPQARQLKFSSSLLSYLKIQLKPWLRFIVCDKVVKLTLRNDFLAKAIEYYLPNRYPKLMNEVRESLLEHFSRPFRHIRQKSNKGIDMPSKEHISRAESIWLDTQVSETMNLLILTNPAKAREYIMNKDHFYLQFLHRSNPEEFIEDYDRLKIIPARKASQSNEELSNLVNFIRQSIFPLRYDGSQIYSQIYCRSYESSKSSAKSRSKKFNEIIAQASCPPIKNFLPISDISIDSFTKTRIGLNAPPAKATSSTSLISAQSAVNPLQQKSVIPSLAQPSQKQPHGPPFQMQQQQGRQKIFTINGNHRHVIVIYPDKNCLSVWDIFEEKPVRTINNVDQPRDLRMVNQKCAVVLCNRELRVYDLDSGQLLTKLKGVMNQKMPYFEVFGQDYVIALARNRMYVNMLNLNTGELETTFKVGEDRFLNSLLVSANGGICVCGDETQKPFPLLVWNLNERRLMYDLRLDRHEFITRMSAISDDGHFVVSVCKQLGSGAPDGVSSTSSSSTPPVSTSGTSGQKSSPNFIVIYDLNSGTLFKKWKPGLDTCAVAISLSANRSGKVMNTIVDNTILVWDLATGSKR